VKFPVKLPGVGDYEDRLAVKKWLTELRGQRTQDDVAALLGVSRKTVVNMESPKEGLPHGLGARMAPDATRATFRLVGVASVTVT